MTRSFQTSTKIILIHGNGGATASDHWFPWANGYYDHPWNWNAIRNNQHWIIQFASTDDPYIPIGQPRYIHEKLNTEYYEYADQGHFGGDEKHIKTTFLELLKALLPKIQ